MNFFQMSCVAIEVLFNIWALINSLIFFFFLSTVNVDEWMKSANSLSPNDMDTGEFVFN